MPLQLYFGLKRMLGGFFWLFPPSSKTSGFTGHTCILTIVTNQFLPFLYSILLCGNSPKFLEDPNTACILCGAPLVFGLPTSVPKLEVPRARVLMSVPAAQTSGTASSLWRPLSPGLLCSLSPQTASWENLILFSFSPFRCSQLMSGRRHECH